MWEFLSGWVTQICLTRPGIFLLFPPCFSHWLLSGILSSVLIPSLSPLCRPDIMPSFLPSVPVVVAHLTGMSLSDSALRKIDGILYVLAGADRDPKPGRTCQTAGDCEATGFAAQLLLSLSCRTQIISWCRHFVPCLVQTANYHRKHKAFFVLHIIGIFNFQNSLVIQNMLLSMLLIFLL